MKNYRPDPNNPRRLTPEEERRLDQAEIDYSDIPELDQSFFTRPLVPNRETVAAMQAVERGEVTSAGPPENLIKSLNAGDGDEIDWSAWSRSPTADQSPPQPLFGADYLATLLLQMVVEHCGTAQPDQLNSYYIPANAEAMIALEEGGEIEILTEYGDEITAKVTPIGRALLHRLRADQHRPDLEWSQCRDVESVKSRCVVTGTRVAVQGILDNAEDGFTPEEIAGEIFQGVTVEQVRRILAFAGVQTLKRSR